MILILQMKKLIQIIHEKTNTIQSMEFSRPEYWSGLPFPFPGDLELGSPALQADSLPAELLGKPNTYLRQ